MQAQPKLHQNLACLNARALSAESGSMNRAGERGISFLSPHILPLHRPDRWKVRRQGMLLSHLADKAVRQPD